MTTPSGATPDDSVWRRPADQPAEAPPPERAAPTPPAYQGPPPTSPPPPGWRPPVHIQPPPPRQLPPQNLAGLEEQERSARTVTYGIGLIAGAVLIVVICLLCARIVF
ncbi:translation initiation factor 2 [Micromonospora sonneratiae]|uniref:Translation initiation factor 2 n=1 Tax=Micromonospora sonneratiae TaxID=1184706 RepID=A0ABW3YG85_9ACTN